jgi:RNA ligase (TIGR02306 family)
MRKMASVRKIDAISPIPNADAIEVATIGGWRVVVKRGEFTVGDLAIYCEVDSWIPNAIAPFLSKDKEPREYDGVKGERLRTVKLRGTTSQGLLLTRYAALDKVGEIFEGMDVSELLGIQKYEPAVPAQLAGMVAGPFPSVFPKTDEERIQNLAHEWHEISTAAYEVTEKLEGSSMSVGLIGGEFIVCSRNLNLAESEGNSFWAQARRYDIEAKMRNQSMDNFIIQGELIGEGVQGNHYGIKGQDFYVFAIYDVNTAQYVSPLQRQQICKDLGLKHVPVISNALYIVKHTVTTILELADGKSQLNPNKLREGLVFKEVGGQAHWKAISNDYLLKTDK